MAYATRDQIAAEFKDISFTSSTPVSDTQVDDFISRVEAMVNAKVGQRYETPVTGTESVKILREIVVNLVADKVRDIVEVKSVPKEDLEQGARQRTGTLEAKRMLKQIVEHELPLPDATLISNKDGHRSFAVDNDLELTYKRNTDQW